MLKSGVTPGPSEKKISLAVVGIKYQINDTGLELGLSETQEDKSVRFVPTPEILMETNNSFELLEACPGREDRDLQF